MKTDKPPMLQTVKGSPEREMSQLFPDVSQPLCKKSPRLPRRVGKCVQLMLICQKLLKPFNTTTKPVRPEEKIKSSVELIGQIRSPSVVVPLKVDVCIQTSLESLDDITDGVFEEGYGSKDLVSDLEGGKTDRFWELDIDSAIVGDLSSMSAFSVTEQIDPLYAAIKFTSDGRLVEKAPMERLSFSHIYQVDDKWGYNESNTSSPRSGVYTKIIKDKRKGELSRRLVDQCRSTHPGSKLNFDRIMALQGHQHHLGVSRGSSIMSDHGTHPPDIPGRNYGSSVVDLITQLRQESTQRVLPPQSRTGSALMGPHPDQSGSKGNIYSSIWCSASGPYHSSRAPCETPLSEPLAPKKSMMKTFNPSMRQIYDDDNDSGEDVSEISIHSASKVKYPRHFSDHNSKTYILNPESQGFESRMTERTDRFRHIDSELDLDWSFSSQDLGLRPWDSDVVPSKRKIQKEDEDDVLYDGKGFLHPLMERSCEEDFFGEHFLSSLEFINV